MRKGRELAELIAIGLVALGAGTLGTMLGLGGGVILVPVLTLIFGLELQTAVAASAIAVVANSVSGSGVYLRARMTNVRLALLMLVPMAAGALAGGLLVVSLPEAVTKGLFALLLFYVAFVMARRRAPAIAASSVEIVLPPDPYRLAGRYQDVSVNQIVDYVPHKLRIGLPVSSLAGVASGMFGIGGGPITVPLLTLVMGVPVKAAASTSSFMVGLTASASALIYYTYGSVNPRVTVAAVFGIVVGARLGARVSARIHPARLTQVFVVVLLLLGVSMALQAIGVL
ncbi:MAG TPA: sulfite exporter TauE/SafE family protein [Thermomicrobiales bacterium]|nr:sulfite exporter TauE/SafE family protein [Thermomicrobiales bacterium]